MVKPMNKRQERGEVELARKRIPLNKLLDGRDFNQAIEGLKAFRAQFAEEEFLYKARIHITYKYGTAIAIVRRPETDKEYSERLALLEQERLEKLERDRIRAEKSKLREETKQKLLKEEADRTRQSEIEKLKEMAQRLGLSSADFVSLGN